jgi:hypothetical protein
MLCGFEMLSGADKVPGAAVELAQRGVEEIVAPQRRISSGFVQCTNAGFRTLDLGHDDRAVEHVHGRMMNREQGVLETQDRVPIRFARPLRRGRRESPSRHRTSRNPR